VERKVRERRKWTSVLRVRRPPSQKEKGIKREELKDRYGEPERGGE
jgi:hypothetical protein